jgi:mono/diheme cytochrome c family protein
MKTDSEIKDGKYRALGLLVCALLLGGGCGSARRGEPIRGPLALSSPKVEQGQQVFMRNCQKCHPGGEAGLGPALNDKAFPEFLKRFQVRHGLGAMPSFSKEEISEAQLDDVMAYLKALRQHKGRPAGEEKRRVSR